MQGGLTKKINIYSIKTNTHRCSSSKALDASKHFLDFSKCKCFWKDKAKRCIIKQLWDSWHAWF